MRDIINASIEGLVERKDREYLERSRVGHEMKDSVLPGLTVMANDKNNESCRALTQALFESGFLTLSERDFNLGQMFGYIYGVKMHESVSAFLTLFDKLVLGGHTKFDRSSMFNPSGDNYYCAMQFQVKPSEDDNWVRKFTSTQLKMSDSVDDFRTDIFRKVIVMEHQSPMYAVVLDYSIFTGNPKEMYFVRLKENYNDPDVLSNLIEAEFNFDDSKVSNKYSAHLEHSTVCKIISKLNVEQMFCEPVYYPQLIDSILFRLNSANDSMSLAT